MGCAVGYLCIPHTHTNHPCSVRACHMLHTYTAPPAPTRACSDSTHTYDGACLAPAFARKGVVAVGCGVGYVCIPHTHTNHPCSVRACHMLHTYTAPPAPTRACSDSTHTYDGACLAPAFARKGVVAVGCGVGYVCIPHTHTNHPCSVRACHMLHTYTAPPAPTRAFSHSTYTYDGACLAPAFAYTCVVAVGCAVGCVLVPCAHTKARLPTDQLQNTHTHTPLLQYAHSCKPALTTAADVSGHDTHEQSQTIEWWLRTAGPVHAPILHTRTYT